MFSVFLQRKMPPAPLAFWPFISPWMLFWGVAAAAPILIHLWSKRRYQEVTWAAMEFLLAAVRKNARRIRLEQLLLLLLRVAILLLLAAALADPVLTQLLNLGGGRGGQTHWVFVIDASYSMDTRRDGESLFQRAKGLAGRIVSESRQGDGFTLLLMGEPPLAVIAEPAFDAEDVSSEIDILALRHGGADLEGALAEVEAIVRKAQDKHPRLTETRMCFFTDLGRNTWDDVSTDDVRQRVATLGELGRLELFDLGQPGEENRAFGRFELRQPLITPGRDVLLEAEILQFGGGPGRQRVELYIDGARVAQAAADVAPNEAGVVSFAHRFTTVGEHTAEVRLADDSRPLDNRRWLSLPVRPAVRALCVQGKPNAARFVSLALQPRQTDRPGVSVELADETALLERDLNEFDCLFLCNIGRFGADEALALKGYLRNGGSVVIFLGDQSQPENYNKMLGPADDGPSLLPAKIGQAVQEQAQYVFDPRGYEHPLIEPFRGHEQTGLLTTPVWKYFRLSPYDESGARVALGFDGGDPAIVEAPAMRGRVMIVATAASTSSIISSANPTPWTALPTWPSFPPLVQEMLRLAVSDQLRDRNLTVGDPIVGAVHGAVANLPLTVEGPNRGENDKATPSRSQRVPLSIDGEDSRWTFEGAHWSGVYEAEFGPPLSQTHRYAVNVDAREGDVARVDGDDIPSQFRRDYSEEDSASSDLPLDKPQPYFRYILSLLLVLLLLESAAAWYFGSGS